MSYSVNCCTSGDGMGMETHLYGDGWVGWNGSSAGMGGDESETGWGRLLNFIVCNVRCVMNELVC